MQGGRRAERSPGTAAREGEIYRSDAPLPHQGRRHFRKGASIAGKL